MGGVEVAQTRRSFIKDLGKSAALFLLPGPVSPRPEYQWRQDNYWDGTTFKERGNTPQEGDLIAFGNTYYLLRNDKRYPMSAQEFATYRSLSKLNEYGRRVFINPNREYLSLPIGVAPKELAILDPFTGQLKRNKPLGGEMNIFIPGCFTDGGVVFEWPFSNLFGKLRGEEGLGEKEWDKLDSFFFTYGAKGLDVFQSRDTAKDPIVNMNNALEFIERIKEELPFVQVNIFAHSLGTLFALEIAKKHPDIINNLVLIGGPVRGLNRNGIVKGPFDLPVPRRTAATVFKNGLRTVGINEYVTDHLLALWEDKGYQKELDAFIEWFRQLGKGLLEFSSLDDRIVPPESTLLRGKDNTLHGRRIPSVWHMGHAKLKVRSLWDLLTLWFTSHWSPLEDPDVITYTTEAFGENRTVA